MRIINMALGFVFLGLAGLGVALPLLPATPFIALAAFFFARSSEKLDNWFKNTKLYKNNFETFSKKKAMKIGEKIRIMVMITITMVIAFIFMKNAPIGRIVLGIVWVGHIIGFTFFIKTLDEEEEESMIKEDK